jgi:hypothetical protein
MSSRFTPAARGLIESAPYGSNTTGTPSFRRGRPPWVVAETRRHRRAADHRDESPRPGLAVLLGARWQPCVEDSRLARAPMCAGCDARNRWVPEVSRAFRALPPAARLGRAPTRGSSAHDPRKLQVRCLREDRISVLLATGHRAPFQVTASTFCSRSNCGSRRDLGWRRGFRVITSPCSVAVPAPRRRGARRR